MYCNCSYTKVLVRFHNLAWLPNRNKFRLRKTKTIILRLTGSPLGSPVVGAVGKPSPVCVILCPAHHVPWSGAFSFCLGNSIHFSSFCFHPKHVRGPNCVYPGPPPPDQSLKVSQVVKGEMSAKTTYQRSAKGPVCITDCAADGKFVALENTGRKVSGNVARY